MPTERNVATSILKLGSSEGGKYLPLIVVRETRPEADAPSTPWQTHLHLSSSDLVLPGQGACEHPRLDASCHHSPRRENCEMS